MSRTLVGALTALAVACGGEVGQPAPSATVEAPATAEVVAAAPASPELPAAPAAPAAAPKPKAEATASDPRFASCATLGANLTPAATFSVESSSAEPASWTDMYAEELAGETDEAGERVLYRRLSIVFTTTPRACEVQRSAYRPRFGVESRIQIGAYASSSTPPSIGVGLYFTAKPSVGPAVVHDAQVIDAGQLCSTAEEELGRQDGSAVGFTPIEGTVSILERTVTRVKGVIDLRANDVRPARRIMFDAPICSPAVATPGAPRPVCCNL